MSYLVDSNVLSELMRPAPARQVVAWLDRHYAECWTSTIVILEVERGIARMADENRRVALRAVSERLFDRFGPRIVVFDRRCASMGAELVGVCRKAGRDLKLGDAAIAGVAGVYDQILVTRNTGDFEKTGLSLVNPWDAA
ncbi:MAG: PIN domain-containing protein [Betaproteobacteria bacterium]|nr:PIN domain-containing protein [Betaproteobacteria bacterium]